MGGGRVRHDGNRHFPRRGFRSLQDSVEKIHVTLGINSHLRTNLFDDDTNRTRNAEEPPGHQSKELVKH
jgi:hypothetical protein